MRSRDFGGYFLGSLIFLGGMKLGVKFPVFWGNFWGLIFRGNVWEIVVIMKNCRVNLVFAGLMSVGSENLASY